MCPSSSWGFTKMQFQRNMTIESDVGFHTYLSSLNNGNILHESTNWHVSVRSVLQINGRNCCLLPCALYTKIWNLPICFETLDPVQEKFQTSCTVKPPAPPKKQQFFRVTYWHVILEQTNTRYMYDLAIDFIMCNTARFWICSCVYGNNSDVACD